MKKIFLLVTFCFSALVNFAQDFNGTYYVGEPNYPVGTESPWKRTFESVEIKYDAGKMELELTWDKTQRPMKAVPHEFMREGLKSGKVYEFTLGNNGPNSLNNAEMLQIEPGVFVVQPATTMDLKRQISRAKKTEGLAKGGKSFPVESLVREFILGKDKKRIEELCANPSQYEELLAAAVIEKNRSADESIAEKNPKPLKGISDLQLNKEVKSLIIDWSVQKNWSQSVIDAYVKSGDWQNVKNALGTVVGREVYCVVVYKENENCRWKEFIVRQDALAKGYGKSYVLNEGIGSYPTSCEATSK